MHRISIGLITAALQLIAPQAPAQPVAQAATTPTTGSPASAGRPRIGLVLSGGGARGLAHVGVLRVLEELQIPIDAIAGTSMGAIVGGLYAGGMDARVLEDQLRRVQWSEVFANRIARPHLSQRRKEEDFEFSSAVELGVRDGELRTPQGVVSSRGLESLLRRFTLPVRDVADFDALPIPFRAVATDMESGQAVVLARGDLSTALRASMSVPGVFAPKEVDGRILGDGGLVNNVPIDVARAMKVDVVIVVSLGTPLSGRESLASAVGLTTQMINILTEQNVQRSLATMAADDVLIAPALESINSGDFERVGEIIERGAGAAWKVAARLQALALPQDEYTAWRQSRRLAAPSAPRLAAVRIEGTELSNPQRLKEMLESIPGQAFDVERAERDTQRLAARGDYADTDYRLVRTEQGEDLVFQLTEKPWGPDYLRIGLDLSTDFSGRSAFNLKLSHNRRWLTDNGTEWRNRLQIGAVPMVFTELYQPLRWAASLADDWFAAGYAGLERRRVQQFAADSSLPVADFKRGEFSAGIDIGQPWGDIGELRLGLSHVSIRNSPQLWAATYTGPTFPQSWNESSVRARVVVDQLDFADFAQSGYRFEGQAFAGNRSGAFTGHFQRLETQATWVRTLGVHSFNLFGRLGIADLGDSGGPGRYTLGGFHQLSGYQPGQFEGNDLLFMRLGWYMRLSRAPALTRGFFVGATVEGGNTWSSRRDIRLADLRSGMSIYLGADTGIGALYLGLTYAARGTLGLALFIGRP